MKGAEARNNIPKLNKIKPNLNFFVSLFTSNLNIILNSNLFYKTINPILSE